MYGSGAAPFTQACLFTILVLAYFLWFAGSGLNSVFAPDDMHNLYRYGEMGWRGVLDANLSFFSPKCRPMGGLHYLPLYALFGLATTPYRLAAF